MKKTFGQILFEAIGMPVICAWESCSPEYRRMLDAAATAVRLAPEPIDHYAELKAALAAGKVIQTNGYGSWSDLTDGADMTKIPVGNLRIKPWELSRHIPGFRPLEPGEEWHRNDFTEEMLPEGWRPLLLGETSVTEQDEARFAARHDSFWPQTGSFVIDGYSKLLWRTRRPLPPTKQELERKEFEEWAESAGYAFTDAGLRQWMFVGWQAARKQKEAK